MEEGGALSSMVANGGAFLRFLSTERRERLDRDAALTLPPLLSAALN